MSVTAEQQAATGDTRTTTICHRYSGAVLMKVAGSDMIGGDLCGANLLGANLRGADLRRAELIGANLRGADLRGANLSGANLSGADLRRADPRGANLIGTILDPAAAANGGMGEWQDAGEGCVWGWRTRTSQFVGDWWYEDGETYTAPVFSTCPYTECHPGLYLYPTPAEVESEFPDAEVIRVRCARVDLHSAGGKHRCRSFTVVPEVTYLDRVTDERTEP